MTDPDEPGDLPLRVSTLELFYRLGAAALALAASAVGVTLSVAAEMALLILIVVAALVVQQRAAERMAAVDTVEA
ncbi:MAG: hypothetical protein ACHQCE_19520 [Streptosporangiales bacterium]